MAPLVITYSKRRRGRKRKQQLPPDNVKRVKKVCQFCMCDEDNEIKFGAILEKEDVTVHYFCMLLSSGLCQNTRESDQKSILGFLLSDIKKELQRGKKLKCFYCRNNGATIGCSIRSCRKVFHLSCGRQYGTMHQFFDSFRSYCENHRLKQELSTKSTQISHQPRKICSICLCTVSSFAACDTLIPPCCQKSLFHQHCMQQYALSAGMHYFKCPLCNSVKDFQAEMQTFGIYIPDQDASWEREPNAFHELLERHNSCDVSECICPKGRLFDANSGQYELLLCGWCGSYGSHKSCSGLVERGIHQVCCDCTEIIDRVEKKQEQQRHNNYLVEVDNQQIDLPFIRPSRNRSLGQERNAESSTSSALGLLNVSPRGLTVRHNQNSPISRRKRQGMNSLHCQSSADVQKQKHIQMQADSKWTNVVEGNLQQSKPESPGTSRRCKQSSLQNKEQRLIENQEMNRLNVSNVLLRQSIPSHERRRSLCSNYNLREKPSFTNMFGTE